MNKLEKEFPRSGFSLFDNKSVYWSSSWTRILNVQDIG